MILVLTLWACRKEDSGIQSEPGILKIVFKDQHLTFASGKDFQSQLQKFKSIESKANLTSMPVQEQFYSLLKFETESSEERMIAIMDNYLSYRQKSGVDKKADSLVYAILLSELIESDALKNLINVRGEVQIGDSLYKITPLGTLSCHIRHQKDLLRVYKQLSSLNGLIFRLQEPNAKLEFGSLNIQPSALTGVLVVENVVYFTDTFRDEGEQYFRLPELEDGGGGGGGSGGGGSPPPPPPGNDDPFGDMKEEPIDFREGILNMWDTLRKNRTRYRYFDNKHRISVLFYNRNYLGFKSLGIKVKLQKKGFLWWNKTEAQEIIAGWERMVYKQANAIPSFSRPQNEPPVFASPYSINPYDPPANGWFTQNYASLYEWHFAESSQELFSIVIPQYLLPLTEEDKSIPSSEFKPLILEGWRKLKQILQRSVPMSASGDPDNYPFPVHDINTGRTRTLSINQMETMPKAFNSVPSARQMLFPGQKIRTYLSPYYERKKNVKKIEFDLDFSTATVKLNYNLASPLSVKSVLNSLEISDLDNSYEVEDADVFGTVKYNGRWLGIRLIVQVND